MTGDDWTDREIDAAVASYFATLSDEIAALSFNKAAHNRTLQSEILRNRGSIEFKHHNSSAMMLGVGQPWITGYKPKANFQNARVDGVPRWPDVHGDWLKPKSLTNRVADGGAGQVPFHGPSVEQPIQYGTVPSQRNEPPPADPQFTAAIGRKFDVAERDA